MRDETVARNYAETLFELARRDGDLEAFEAGIEMVARLIDENDDFRRFVETPRIADEKKKDVIRRTFAKELPGTLLNFVLITLDKRRQRLLRPIAKAFHALVDEHEGRTHVEVTVARSLDDQTVAEITKRLSTLMGRTAIPHVRVKPEILGGIILRTGDTVYDGSIRRRIEGLRRRLNDVDLPEMPAFAAEV